MFIARVYCILIRFQISWKKVRIPWPRSSPFHGKDRQSSRRHDCGYSRRLIPRRPLQSAGKRQINACRVEARHDDQETRTSPASLSLRTTRRSSRQRPPVVRPVACARVYLCRAVPLFASRRIAINSATRPLQLRPLVGSHGDGKQSSGEKRAGKK